MMVLTRFSSSLLHTCHASIMVVNRPMPKMIANIKSFINTVVVADNISFTKVILKFNPLFDAYVNLYTFPINL